MAKKKKAEEVKDTEIVIPETHVIEQEPEAILPTFKDEGREAIYARYQEHLQSQEPETPSEPTPEPIADSAPEPVADALAEPVAEPASPPEPPKPDKHKITVNGQQMELTIDELIILAQKSESANQRYQEAARLRQEAEALRNSQPKAEDAQPQSPEIPEEDLRDIAQRLNYGSDEEQVKALKDAGILFTKAMGQPPLTPETLVNQATQNALAVLTAQQEQEILRKEFPDIADDVPLAHATDLIANQLVQKYAALGLQKPRLEILREAGATAREKYLRPQPVTVPKPEIAVDKNRIEVKRTAPQPPAAASATASSKPASSSANHEDVVLAMRKNAFAEIAKSRGQTVYS